MKTEIRPVGNWNKIVGDQLKNALRISVEVTGRSASEACKHAIILMAQSAAKMTKLGKKNRTIQRDDNKRPYLAKLGKGGEIKRWYLPNRKQNLAEYNAMMAQLRPIANRGLAKKSWMWGLKKLKGAPMGTKPIRGVAWLRTIVGRNFGGYILTNSLHYVLKAMPPGWKTTVIQRATNKVMNRAKDSLERKWKRDIKSGRKSMAPMQLKQYFSKV